MHRSALLFILACASFACAPDASPQRSSDEVRYGAEATARAAELEQARADLLALQARTAELESELVRARSSRHCEEHGPEVRRLRAELAALDERRIEREREWLRFLRNLKELGLPEPKPEHAFVPDLPPEEQPKPPDPTPIDTAKLEREAALARSLRALVSVEGLTSLDLLEAGHLGEGWLGPVLFRVLDSRGRLAGSVYAERLRLEGSRAARTLTLVLESGYEMRGGERVAFGPGSALDGTPIEGGVRRLEILDCDPTRWAEPLGELFGQAPPPPVVDDGRWSLVYVKGALNRLLRLDAASGYWRVRSLNGVLDGALREVHLEELDARGALQRRVFADVLRIVRQERGFLLELSEGAQMRGEEKTPFLDGRFRIFLPRASHSEWDAAVLPGLSEPDEAAAPPSSG